MVDRYPAIPESPTAQLVGQVAKIEQDFRDLRSNLLRAAGLQAEPDLLRVLGSLVVEGDLSVPNGSIDNDALKNPILAVVKHGWSQGFAITTSTTVYESVTATVPSGYTQAIVTSVATGMGYNSSGGSDWLYVASTLSGATGGSEVYAGMASGQGGAIASPNFDLITGLVAGETITVGCQMRTQSSTWPANSGNVARIDAQISFLR